MAAQVPQVEALGPFCRRHPMFAVGRKVPIIKLCFDGQNVQSGGALVLYFKALYNIEESITRL